MGLGNVSAEYEAVEIFEKGGIMFGPAKAVNAGGVATSALEMSQNAAFENWTAEEVDAKLQQIMIEIYRICSETSEKYGQPGNLVMGANVAGFLKVANAMIDQGVV